MKARGTTKVSQQCQIGPRARIWVKTRFLALLVVHFFARTPNREKGACILSRNTPAAFSALPTAPGHDRKSPARSAPVRPDQAVSSDFRGLIARPGCSRRPARHG